MHLSIERPVERSVDTKRKRDRNSFLEPRIAMDFEHDDFHPLADDTAESPRCAAEDRQDDGATSGEAVFEDDPKANELSSEFVVRWEKLISTTNWEKGRIIYEWREALKGSQAPASTYSDEVWARRVGGVTPQHVGRLRRVYERFGSVYQSYPGLYWSHFLAAMDWHDAEMWLEGAAQSRWSVSQMRRARWEAMGADPDAVPSDAELKVADDIDEDFTPLDAMDDRRTSMQDGTRTGTEGPLPEGPDFGDESDIGGVADAPPADVLPWEGDDEAPQESPFTDLPSLPTDIADAVEQFKLAIIRHRAESWAEVSPSDVLKALDALRAFVLQESR